jgi:hypothetical protein
LKEHNAILVNVSIHILLYYRFLLGFCRWFRLSGGGRPIHSTAQPQGCHRLQLSAISLDGKKPTKKPFDLAARLTQLITHD